MTLIYGFTNMIHIKTMIVNDLFLLYYQIKNDLFLLYIECDDEIIYIMGFSFFVFFGEYNGVQLSS